MTTKKGNGDVIQVKVPDIPTPPHEIADVGPGDFLQVGRQFLEFFVGLGDLRPDDRVLDVGCGVGRMASPLVGYLSGQGLYEGFDVVEQSVAWCRDQITSRASNFTFRHVDLCNTRYNQSGKDSAANFEFPYSSGYFDFVILTSVFTHLLQDEVENYLAEVRRVTRTGARVFCTWYLLNPESRRHMAEGHSKVDFPHGSGVCRLARADIPEAVVAYDENYVLGLYEDGFKVKPPVWRGWWSGRPGCISGQDMIVAYRV